MASDIKGKTALITGSAKRVGRATAFMLANSGANIIIHYRSSESEAKGLVDEIKKLGVEGWAVQGDLAVQIELETLLERSVQIAGRPINILINNASAFPKTNFQTVTFEDLEFSIKVDAWAPFVLGRQFAEMSGAEHIVNMLDTRIVADYDWLHFAYNAAKHMLGLFTKMMAIQFAPHIAVNGVAPGLILPPEGMNRSYLEQLKESLPMRKIGDPVYVAEAILYLVTSQFITGQTIFVDGGRHLNEAGSG